jgi:steroid delta-isomerase-like uncharacterized protein
MTESHNRYIVMRYFKEIMTEGNLGTLYELLTPDFVFTLPTHPEPYIGPDGFKELVTMLHGCFPDFFIHAQEMVASGDMVVTRWRGGGTHLGGAIHTVAGDVPPSGRSFEIDGMSWHRIHNGRIVEVIGHEDTIGMFEQLGVMPSLRTTTPPEANAEVARRFLREVLTEGKLSLLKELLAPDFEFTLPTLPGLRGAEALTGYVSLLRQAFSPLSFVEDRIVSDFDKVALRWRMQGKHVGEFNGVPASGAEVSEYGISFFEFRGGKITAIRVVANQLGLQQQISVAAPPPALTPEANNAIAVRFFDGAWNRGDFGLLDALVAPDVRDHSTVAGKPTAKQGHASFVHIIGMFRQALPDLHLSIEDEVYAGDRVVHRWVIEGTDTGGVMGMPASGKRVRLSGITTVRMAGGRIVERWSNVDELGLLQQLGVVPPVGA